MKCVFRRSFSDVKPNSLFLWGLPSASCSDNHSNTDVTLPGGPCPFGQTLSCPFRTVLTLLHLPFVLLGDSEDPGRGQPCWVTAESFLTEPLVETLLKSQESGERRHRCVAQLIHLALRLAWPTNYLSKGHSQAPRGFCSHSEGKMSPKKPCKQPARCVRASLIAAHYQTFAFTDQTWARECPKKSGGIRKTQELQTSCLQVIAV